jgi:hypothetical protein
MIAVYFKPVFPIQGATYKNATVFQKKYNKNNCYNENAHWHCILGGILSVIKYRHIIFFRNKRALYLVVPTGFANRFISFLKL